MDLLFTDLDLISLKVRNPDTKKYFLEAVKSYKIGALRSSISAIWVAVVYDLISKFRELATLDDKAAEKFIEDWDKAVASNSVSKLLELERNIIEYATVDVQLLNIISKNHMMRLKDDRNLCAHPAFSSEADLFAPTPELTRSHLIHAVNYVLELEPLQGKAIIDYFDRDIRSLGFPSRKEDVESYVLSRYLEKMRENNINNLVIVLAKSLINAVPENWKKLNASKVLPSLKTVKSHRPAIWENVKPKLTQILNQNMPENARRIAMFVGEFPEFWDGLQIGTQTSIRAVLEGVESSDKSTLRGLRAGKIPALHEVAVSVIGKIEEDSLAAAYVYFPHDSIIDRLLNAFENSGSYRAAESRFSDHLQRLASQFSSEHLVRILRAVSNNGQIALAHLIPEQILNLFQSVSEEALPSSDELSEIMEGFYQQHPGWYERFEDLWAFLSEHRNVFVADRNSDT
tara:strand:- start:12 stop:1385 length:1374 start_codon:yes stop_codon:yes gene_type:complete